MSEDDAGEIGGDLVIGDRQGERRGVVKGDDGWDVNGDEGGSVERCDVSLIEENTNTKHTHKWSKAQ